MKDALMEAIQTALRERQQRLGMLDEKIVDFSRDLAKSEVKSHETFINNEYFMRVSDPTFCRLTAPEQLMCLALWHCERTRSVPDNRFSFECRKQVEGLMIDFAVYLQAANVQYRAALECGAPDEKRKKIEDLGYPVLNFSTAEIWQRPLDVAEEVFAFLDQMAENQPNGLPV